LSDESRLHMFEPIKIVCANKFRQYNTACFHEERKRELDN